MLILNSEQLNMGMVRELGIDHIKAACFQERQRHRCIQLTFMLRGTLSWQLADGSQIKLNGGEGCLTQQGDVINVLYDVLSPCLLVWLIFDPFAPEAPKGSFLTREELFPLGQSLAGTGHEVGKIPRELMFYLNEIISLVQTEEWNRGGTFPRQKLRLLLHGVFLESVAMFSLRPSVSGGRSAIAEQVKKLVLDRPDHDFNIDELARLLNLSSSRFVKNFKRETGIPAADFIRRVKLEEALRLMRTGRNITETAFSLGFSSSQYFATSFKKYFGRTPRQFRKEQC